MRTQASGRKRLGVIGTFVWDSIYPYDPLNPSDAVRTDTAQTDATQMDTARTPIEAWGGITYALAALDAALPDDWEIVPAIQVGTDLAEQAREFLATLRHCAADMSLAEVPQPNNRVALRYHSQEHRSEYLTGGVPGWEWERLRPRLRDLDALYINLISGMELELHTMQLIRREFSGVIYCDLRKHTQALSIAGPRSKGVSLDVAGDTNAGGQHDIRVFARSIEPSDSTVREQVEIEHRQFVPNGIPRGAPSARS